MASGLIVTVRHPGMRQPFLGWVRNEKRREAEFSNNWSLGKNARWKPMRHVAPAPRHYFNCREHTYMITARMFWYYPSGAGMCGWFPFQLEWYRSRGFQPLCILLHTLPGRSPGLKVVYIISTVPWAQCKQFRVSVINTHRISPATARPGLAVLCGFPDPRGSQDHQSVNDEERTRAEFLETLTWYDDMVWH